MRPYFVQAVSRCRRKDAERLIRQVKCHYQLEPVSSSNGVLFQMLQTLDGIRVEAPGDDDDRHGGLVPRSQSLNRFDVRSIDRLLV